MTLFHDGYGNFWRCGKCKKKEKEGLRFYGLLSPDFVKIAPCDGEDEFSPKLCWVSSWEVTGGAGGNCGDGHGTQPGVRCLYRFQAFNMVPGFAYAEPANQGGATIEKLFITKGHQIVVQWISWECHNYDLYPNSRAKGIILYVVGYKPDKLPAKCKPRIKCIDGQITAYNKVNFEPELWFPFDMDYDSTDSYYGLIQERRDYCARGYHGYVCAPFGDNDETDDDFE